MSTLKNQKIIPFPFHASVRIGSSFQPVLVPNEFVSSNDYNDVLKAMTVHIAEKEQKKVRPFTEDAIVWKLVSSLKSAPANAKIFSITIDDVPKRAEKYIRPNGFTETGYKYFRKAAKDLYNGYQNDIVHAGKNIETINKLFADAERLKKVKSSECYTGVKYQQIPQWIFGAIYPAIVNPMKSSFTCRVNDTMYITHGTLKRLVKSGRSTHTFSDGYTVGRPYNNKERIIDNAAQIVQSRIEKTTNFRKVFLNDPQKLYIERNKVYDQYQKMVNETQVFIHLKSECNGIQPQLFDLNHLPNKLELIYPAMNGGIPVIVPKKATHQGFMGVPNDICPSEQVLHRNGEWGTSAVVSMFGGLAGGEKITDPQHIAELNTLKARMR